MSKHRSTPMTLDAASRIARATAAKTGGHIPPGSFASRADSAAQRTGSVSARGANSGGKGGKRG